MGNDNCKDLPTRDPDTANICSNIDSIHDIPFSCASITNSGDAVRDEWCGKLGAPGEWVSDGTRITAPACTFNSCFPYKAGNAGCCGDCCGIRGQQIRCKRVGYGGDPGPCCLQDYICNTGSTDNSECFSDANQKNTCALVNRDVTTNSCREAVINYCSGTDLPPGDSTWINRWTRQENSCINAIYRNLYKTCSPTIPSDGICNQPLLNIDSAGYFWTRELLAASLKRYRDDGFILGSLPGTKGYSIFQNVLYDKVCCPFPSLCQDGLNNACSMFTSQRISLNPSISQWCGCHLPDTEYDKYSKQYNIPRECTPLCNREGVIPVTGINGDIITCDRNVCLIDDITVNLIDSQVAGSININQICNSCPNANCSCIVSNNTLSILNTTIRGNLNLIDQNCNRLTCNVINIGLDGPEIITVPCDEAEQNINQYQEYDTQLIQARTTAKNNSMILNMAIIVMILIFIFIIMIAVFT